MLDIPTQYISIKMSSVCSKENYSIISHLQYLHDLYKETKSDSNISKLTFSNDFFKINSQFLRQNQINKNTDKRQDVKKKKQKETTCNNLDQVIARLKYLCYKVNFLSTLIKTKLLFITGDMDPRRMF